MGAICQAVLMLVEAGIECSPDLEKIEELSRLSCHIEMFLRVQGIVVNSPLCHDLAVLQHLSDIWGGIRDI